MIGFYANGCENVKTFAATLEIFGYFVDSISHRLVKEIDDKQLGLQRNSHVNTIFFFAETVTITIWALHIAKVPFHPRPTCMKLS